jgi:hypothetical protein
MSHYCDYCKTEVTSQHNCHNKPSQPSTASGEQEAEVVVRSNEYIELRWMGHSLKQGELWERQEFEELAKNFNESLSRYHSFRLSAEAEKKAEKIAQRFLCTKEFSDYKNIVAAIKQILEAEHDIP